MPAVTRTANARSLHSRRLPPGCARRRSTTAFSRRGVRAFSVYNHMLLPVMYESLEADYRHLLERVQLWDVSGERQVEIRGRDALRTD